MSCESEVISAVIAAINADTGTGGLLNSASAAYIRELYRRDDPNGERASGNWPAIEVSCSSQSGLDTFGSGAYMADVRIRILTDMDTGFTNHDAVCARLRTVLHRVTFTAGSTYGFSAFRIVRWIRLEPINLKELQTVADGRLVARVNSGL